MRKLKFALWMLVGFLALQADAPHAQGQAQAPAPAQTGAQTTPTFHVSVDLVNSDVIVRNRRGQFQADLSKDDFELFEDGVKQDLTSFVMIHGGRAYTTMVAAPTPIREGIILPAARPANDTAGRVILFVVDDLHMEFRDTHRIRKVFRDMAKELIHDGDLFGIVSTGTSSIAIDLTYDRTRMEEAANKITGGGLRPSEIIQQSAAGETPQEVMHRAHVAFSTANDIINNLSQVHNRRKAFIYVSNGYDFNPFKETRTKQEQEKYGTSQGNTDDGSGNANNNTDDPFKTQGNKFYQADLVNELSYLTRAANRANVTMYTIDPRGLVGMPDLDEKIDMVEWQNYVRTSQDSLRTIAELTGGYAAVNQNDFDKALKRIDAETSDYYVVGYYSNNPDPRKRNRTIEIKVTRDGLNVMHRKAYTLRKAAEPTPASK